MTKLVVSSMETVRKIASQLRPDALDHLGLAAAVEWLCHEFRARTGIVCQCDVPQNIVMDDEQATALFRICQEALTNVARHANATRVDMRLEERTGEMILEVRDNGKGIEQGLVENRESMGLLGMGMNEQAATLGGTLNVIVYRVFGLLASSVPIFFNPLQAFHKNP